MKKILGVVLSFGLIFFIPYAVNWLFSNPAPCDLMVARWNEAEALGYGGDVLSFVGTVVLGAIAVYQTSQAHGQTERANQLAQDALTQTEKANELAAQMQKLEQAKFVSMVSYRGKDRIIHEVASSQASSIHKTSLSTYDYFDLGGNNPQSERYFIIDAEIENKSEFPIVQIGIHPGTMENSNCILYGMKTYVENAVYIPANSKGEIRIGIPADILKSTNTTALSLTFIFTNIFDYNTRARLDIENLGVMGKFTNTTYRLAKFVDVKPKDAE